ncbi:DinB family protein [Pedobacter borealis]|uniref:DinB family protein n=1 Tax=Pedobacter borealis TaxID=475254 RepID=UPI0004930434|nr:DinB family protein [Pedobacter borealis]
MEKIIKEAAETLLALENTLSKFDTAQINAVPFKGSWTAGQLAEHMILSNSGFLQVINGPVTETDKPADFMVAQIRNDFLNFNVKYDSPKEIYPKDKVYNQYALLESLKQIRDRISTSIANLDLTKTCSSFELPGYGFLTRLEAVYFVIYHTQRHVHQLNKIYSELDSN